jgi:hypothetical protein
VEEPVTAEPLHGITLEVWWSRLVAAADEAATIPHNLIIDIDAGIDNRCRALSTTAAPAGVETPDARRNHLMTAPI